MPGNPFFFFFFSHVLHGPVLKGLSTRYLLAPIRRTGLSHALFPCHVAAKEIRHDVLYWQRILLPAPHVIDLAHRVERDAGPAGRLCSPSSENHEVERLFSPDRGKRDRVGPYCEGAWLHFLLRIGDGVVRMSIPGQSRHPERRLRELMRAGRPFRSRTSEVSG